MNLVVENVKLNKGIQTRNIGFGASEPKQQAVEEQNKKSKIVPVGIFAAGTVLLYLGLKSPVNAQLQKYANDKFYLMSEKTKDYIKLVKTTISDVYSDIPEILNGITKSKKINTKPFQEEISQAQKATEVLELQDKAIGEISANKRGYQGGMQATDKFRDTLENHRLAVWEAVAPEKNSNKALFENWSTIPPFEDGSNQKLIDKYNKILKEHSDINVEQMVGFTDKELEYLARHNFEKFSEVIVNAREDKFKAKGTILTEALERIKAIAPISSDFELSFDKTLTLDKFSQLTSNELKPQSLTSDITKILEGNSITEAVLTKDFNNISEGDLKAIFYRIQDDNSLRDLRYLIDQIRLADEVKNVELRKVKDVVIPKSTVVPKLEYLWIKLNEFGENELIKKLGKDFSTLDVEQKRAALYYVNDISKRLGYSSLNLMDEKLYRSNQNYDKLKLNNLMLEIKLNPDKYFF